MRADFAPSTLGFCGHCGGELAAGEEQFHAACARRYPLDPPRFCSTCRRRMKVVVTPAGWVATCSVHGAVTST